jgi:hypothetical protein
MAITLSDGASVVTIREKGEWPADGRLTDAEIAKLSDAERIDYCRRFDQSKMPAWSDPRKG